MTTADLRYHKTSGVTTLAAGETLTVEIETRGASDIATFVTDGSGGAPTTYDLRQEYRPVEGDVWMPYDVVTGSTAHSFIDPAVAGHWWAVLTNQSGASADYRLRVIGHGGIQTNRAR